MMRLLESIDTEYCGVTDLVADLGGDQWKIRYIVRDGRIGIMNFGPERRFLNPIEYTSLGWALTESIPVTPKEVRRPPVPPPDCHDYDEERIRKRLHRYMNYEVFPSVTGFEVEECGDVLVAFVNAGGQTSIRYHRDGDGQFRQMLGGGQDGLDWVVFYINRFLNGYHVSFPIYRTVGSDDQPVEVWFPHDRDYHRRLVLTRKVAGDLS